ncbi:hypothetical protein DPEC_G00056140 [Dallia pectoralis]|uniref:Uncharacterized protein n=1 Tax=Dallia pectoralis TaxID=75939 RepID=A0ACC2H5I7_DALPE|nr:hypothetical protein DPEC_G00056140 [Dallia pectoralis]
MANPSDDPTKSVPEQLLAVLEQLTSEELKTFQWYLKQPVLDGSSPLPVCKLENAKREDTIDQLVQTYGKAMSLKISHHILEKMKRNDLAAISVTSPALSWNKRPKPIEDVPVTSVDSSDKGTTIDYVNFSLPPAMNTADDGK